MTGFVFQILRRITGSAGAPALKSGQLFSNEVEKTIYLGMGDDGSGNSTSQPAIGGIGAFVDKASAQTISGAKTFTTSPLVPTPAAADNSANAAPTSWVQALVASVTSVFAPKASPTFSGIVTVPTQAFGDNSGAAANTSFVQTALSALANGLQVKATADYATAAALPPNTYANGAITASANGALTVDSGSPAAGRIVLVKNEAAASNNGLYVVTNPGAAGAPFVLTRHSDMNASAQFSGAFIPVGYLGSVNANSLWLCNPTGVVTIGTTAIPFTQLNGATDLIPQAGIAISGNGIAVAGISAVTNGSLLKWNGTQFVMANAGTDYIAPGTTFDSGTA